MCCRQRVFDPVCRFLLHRIKLLNSRRGQSIAKHSVGSTNSGNLGQKLVGGNTRINSIPERVEYRHVETFKVAHISCYDRQVLHNRTGCNHGIFINGVRLSMHQFCPDAKGGRIHGEYVVGSGDLIGPSLNVCGFDGILFTGYFDASLYFTQRYSAEVNTSSATASSQATTAPWGRTLRSSETTLVSRRYICALRSCCRASLGLPARGYFKISPSEI